MVVSVDEEAAMETIKYWDPKDRPQMTLIGGGPSNVAREHEFICIAGVTGSGKSSVRKCLNKVRVQKRLSPLVSVTKASTRDIRAEEAEGVVPFTSISEREWFESLIQEEKSGLASVFVGLHPPYPEWDWWSEELEVAPPTTEVVVKSFLQFAQLYEMASIETAVDRAISRKTRVIIELFPQDAAGWLRVFPRTQVVVLNVDPFVVRQRIENRWGLDPVVSRARLLDGVSTPVCQLLDTDIVLSNNTEDELVRNIRIIEETIRSGWG